MKKKNILITGGTGSFGQHFTRFILKKNLFNKIIIFSRDEQKQEQMFNSIDDKFKKKVRFFMGDIRDKDRLQIALNDVDYLVHAAALKIVPSAEYNPTECIKTNVIGAQNVVECALNQKIKKVLALSTDKACNPVNLYGASKLASDKIFIASNHLSQKHPVFSVVRYGNVLGSRGSVIPLFLELDKKNSNFFPITHKDMTRFFITLDHSVNFVYESLNIMNGGEIFIPKIPSIKIVDLAKVINEKKPIKFIGLRPGEKLHEIMISKDDARLTEDRGNYYIIHPTINIWDRKRSMRKLKTVDDNFEYSSLTNKHWLQKKELTKIIKFIRNK
jgi:UDP-N-acetylglucosamine 4,6-dehydratase|tara:strand:+ start:3831 stop:4820 length:990 start_codon:yes stop_codon:yes gene_type:complete